MNNLYTLSLDSIKYILGLIRDTVDLPANILDDLHIQSTTTYSSYRLDTLLKALKEENIQYCDEAISKLNKLSKEIITDKLQITNENTIYLLLTDPVNNVYEQWLLINGTPQMIGTTEMKLDSVYTKDEADDRYALLTDFNTLTTSFNNLVTSVDKKIDKDNIVTVLDDTVTDEQVPSAKIVYDNILTEEDVLEIVNKEGLKFIDDANDETLTNGKYATKTTTANLPTSAYGILIIEKFKDNNSTWVKQTYKPLADQIYVRSKINDLDWTDWQKIVVEIEKAYGQAVAIEDELDLLTSRANAMFANNGNTGELVDLTGQKLFRIEHRVVTANKSYVQVAYDITTGKLIATRSKNWWNSTWSAWNLVCTTKVKGVSKTTKALNTTVCTSGSAKYEVKNGVCYVQVWGVTVTGLTTSGVVIAEDLPKANITGSAIGKFTSNGNTTNVFVRVPENDSKLYISALGTAQTGSCTIMLSFSYPVAE